MNKEPTLEQALVHLMQMAIQANAPLSQHEMSKKCFEVLKIAVEPSVKSAEKALSSVSKQGE